MSKKTPNVVVALTAPISVDGAMLSELTVRRPKVRDMLAIENMTKNDAEKEIHLFANLCEVSPESLYELDMADYGKLQKVYQDFLS
ncbi:MAG: phage tail assembly protein [Agarilytica sp.]